MNGLTGEEKANLTKDCLTKLHEVEVKVVSFTCDGPTTHQAMFKLLGARLSAENLQAYFPHPCDNNQRIYIFLDACHMIKLVRNTMSEWKVLKDGDGNTIEWKFLEELHKLQESEGLRLANKLRAAHIDWKQQKMKVNLAAQTLSSSVADALEYCEGKLHELPQFKGCGPTVKFIRTFDRLFDVLNSRNPKANNFKAPIRKTNYQYVKRLLDDACDYIKGLKGPGGQSILTSKRKTGFLGFFMCAKAVNGLAKDLVCGENPVLKYLLTYKTSQDDLELFFGAVRASGGWNNNPTAMQFRSAYKQLLMRHNITGGQGNCVPQDDTEMLSNVENKSNGKSSTVAIEDVMIARKYGLALRDEPAATDHDYCDIGNSMELSNSSFPIALTITMAVAINIALLIFIFSNVKKQSFAGSNSVCYSFNDEEVLDVHNSHITSSLWVYKQERCIYFGQKSYSGLSLLLILAGDVELCPGPSVKCVSCNKTIRKNQSSETCCLCESRCHLKCLVDAVDHGHEDLCCPDCVIINESQTN